jgi:hypothetical protein
MLAASAAPPPVPVLLLLRPLLAVSPPPASLRICVPPPNLEQGRCRSLASRLGHVGPAAARIWPCTLSAPHCRSDRHLRGHLASGQLGCPVSLGSQGGDGVLGESPAMVAPTGVAILPGGVAEEPLSCLRWAVGAIQERVKTQL